MLAFRASVGFAGVAACAVFSEVSAPTTPINPAIFLSIAIAPSESLRTRLFENKTSAQREKRRRQPYVPNSDREQGATKRRSVRLSGAASGCMVVFGSSKCSGADGHDKTQRGKARCKYLPAPSLYWERKFPGLSASNKRGHDGRSAHTGRNAPDAGSRSHRRSSRHRIRRQHNPGHDTGTPDGISSTERTNCQARGDIRHRHRSRRHANHHDPILPARWSLSRQRSPRWSLQLATPCPSFSHEHFTLLNFRIAPYVSD